MVTTLRTIENKDLELILRWRTSKVVTKYMNTNPKLTLEGQEKWLTSIKSDNNVCHWLIEVDSSPAGLIYLIDIDWENKNTSWGYYIGELKLRSFPLAISLEASLYDYCFDVLEFNEVHNEVFKLNDGVVKLHTLLGNKVIKIGKNEVEKEGVKYDIVHLSIEKEEWLSLRGKISYEKIDFNIFD